MKEKALQEIVQIMQEHNLTIDEVMAFAEENLLPRRFQEGSFEQFDLRCLVYGVWKRVPFEEGKDQRAIGLFPFKDDNHYLGFWEGEFSRKFANEERLPTIDFCEQLLPLLPKINLALDILGKPRLQGDYYARANRSDGLNWIVTFDESRLDSLPCDYYDTPDMAKMRYVEEFHE